MKKNLLILILIIFSVKSFSEKKLMEFQGLDKAGKPIYSKNKIIGMNGSNSGEVILIPEKFQQRNEMFRSTWVASVDNMHFPKKVNGKVRGSVEELKEDWIEILNNHEKLNLNVVIFQVSPTLDALYSSKHRPWSHVLSGTQGKAPEWAENFDLIQWMITETHRRGMEFHAWFNPYRVSHRYDAKTQLKTEIEKLSDDNFGKKNPELMYMFDKRLYLDPGNPKTQKHILDTVGEFLEKYDVDAIHFDDYFYPYKVVRDGKTNYFGDLLEDRETFKKNTRNFKFIEDISTAENLELYQEEVKKWRRDNNDIMVAGIKKVINEFNEKKNSAVRWGISPFGIWEHREDNPKGKGTPITSTSSNRDIYADTRSWVLNEEIDYIIPQIYWEFAQPAAPYGEIAKWWDSVVEGKKTHLYIGHASYKHLNAGRVKVWENPEEIMNQLKFNQSLKNVKGSAFFGYSNILMQENKGNSLGINSQNRHVELLMKEYLNKKALTPGFPWLDRVKTEEIARIEIKKNSKGIEVNFKDSLKNDSRFYVIYSGKEILKVVGRDKENENQKIFLSMEEIKDKKITGIAIKDRAGVLSKIFPVKI